MLQFHMALSLQQQIRCSGVYGTVLFLVTQAFAPCLSFMDSKQVIHSQIQEGGRVITDKLLELEFAVYRLAVEPASPHTFYCCCQDSSVWLVCC